jgi:hypothetical protein
MATTIFTLPQTLDHVLAIVQEIQGTLASHGPTLTQLVQRGIDLKTILDQNSETINEIRNLLQKDRAPSRVKFNAPEAFNLSTGKVIVMAQSIMNDVGTKIGLDFFNVGGVEIPAPADENVQLDLWTDATMATHSDLGSVAMDTLMDGSMAVAVRPAQKGVSLGMATISFADLDRPSVKATFDIEFVADNEVGNVIFDPTETETFPLDQPQPGP